MPKFMNIKYGMPMNLQFFAEGGDGGSNAADDAGDGGDQDGEETPEENVDDEPQYTEADLNEAVKKAVARTIAKERRKAEKAAAKKQETKNTDEDAKAESAADADKMATLELKIACFNADVKKEAVDDVAILAKAYMDADEDLDIDEAIEKVTKKHPQFTNAADPADKKDEKSRKFVRGTNGTYKPDAVTDEKAFLDQRYAGNPYYKK
jgi:hypothetical protein